MAESQRCQGSNTPLRGARYPTNTPPARPWYSNILTSLSKGWACAFRETMVGTTYLLETQHCFTMWFL